jgi:type I protein arginine methyltransferase
MSIFATDRNTPHRGLPADVIPLQYHVPMLADEHRMTSFIEAISDVVSSGNHVLDLGTGTGVMSYFAARQGAVVTAVEREPIVLAAARTALGLAGCETVRLVHADAREYLPDDPVDVVVCEMLHVGLLRERQIEVIGAFKRRYLDRFGGPLPRFLPEACVQAVQPIQQDFAFHGYTVMAPAFQSPFCVQPRTVELASPQVFQQFFYDDPLPVECAADLEFTIERPGRFNAIRIVTKNLLVARLTPPGSVEWLMNYLVVPLPQAVAAERGESVRVQFRYRPGDEINVLAANVAGWIALRDRGTVRRHGSGAGLRTSAWSLAALDELRPDELLPHRENRTATISAPK